MLTGVILPRDVVHIPDDAVDRAVEAVVVLRSQSEGDARACERARHENGRTSTLFSGAGGGGGGAYRKMATLPPSNMRAWSEPGSTPSRDAIEKLLPFTLQHRGERREPLLRDREFKSRTRRCVQRRRWGRR